MIIQAICQHCGHRFETEVASKSEFCPSCGKETYLYAPSRAVSATKPDRDELDGLIAAGYITAILLPLVGFIIGIILLAKNRVGSGLACIIVSVICGFIALAILSNL